MQQQQSMSDYYNAGFKTILPIIPPGAKISTHSVTLQDKPEMLGKIPGLMAPDGWVGYGDWVNRDATEADIAKWDKWDCGIGLRCQDVIAIDIDVTDSVLADIVLHAVHDVVGFLPPIRTGNAPKVLALFRGSLDTKTVLKFTDILDDAHLVEVLGARQQFVVEGIHPKTGKPYQWDTDLVDLGYDGLPELTESDVTEILASIKTAMEAQGCLVNAPTKGNNPDARDFDGLKCSDMSVLATAVAYIPNIEETSREYFIKMAHAIKAASIDAPAEGLAVFESWSDKRPDGQSDGEPARVFESVKTAGVGVQWIMEEARKFGFSEEALDFEGDVYTGPAPDPEDWQPDGDDVWNRFVYVNGIKRFVDLKTNQRLDKEQFTDRHRDQGKGASSLFLESRRPHSFADVVGYIPGNTNRVIQSKDKHQTILNMWKPGPVHYVVNSRVVTEEEVAPWLELGRHLFGDDKERDDLVKWMAHLVQYPGVKPNWHPLVGSDIHGTGKDSFFLPLTKGLGDNVSTIRTSDLESEWTWWAENVQLVIVSEISTFERKAVMQRLKSFMATPPDTIDINIKGMPQYAVPNVFGMVMFTNSTDGAAIERHDRRFYVVWSAAQPLKPVWYERYYDWIHNSKGLENVLRYLMQMDLTGFSVRGNAPATQAKEEMRRAAASSIEGTIESAINEREGPFQIELLQVSDVEAFLKAKGHRPLGAHKLASILRDCGCTYLGRARIPGESAKGIWCSGNEGLYQQLMGSKGAKALASRLIRLREEQSDPNNEFGAKDLSMLN